VNALDNSGTVLLAGTAPATLTIAGAGGLANRASGEVTVLPGASHVLNATLANQGTVTLDGGLTVNRASAQHLNAGLITVAAGQTLTITGGTFTNAAGNPNLQIPPGIIGGEGTLDVSGTTFVNDGTVAPGFSPGLLSLTGAYPGSPTSLLDIELGGTAAGTEYDRLAVSGAAALDGALNVTLVNGFTPGLGDQFTILTYGSMSGAFRSVLLPTLPLGLLWQTATNPTSMVLSVTGPPPRIVFAGDSAGRSIGVFRVNPDASGLFNVTTEGKDDATPRWSPDRSRITYSARATFSVPNQLHVISADGGTPAHLTGTSDTSTWFPRYNPTGKHLAFECGDGFSEFDVCVIPNVDGPIASLDNIGNGTGKTFVTDFDRAGHPRGPGAFAWDPQTQDRLAFVREDVQGFSQIFTSLFNGSDVQALSAPVLDVGKGALTIVDRMDWSSDGSQLVFVAQDPAGDQKLYLINRDGSGLAQLTSGPGTDFKPVFSPDGKTVLFFRDITCSLDLWRVDVGSGTETQVTSEDMCDLSTDVLGFDWSPDGTEIVVSGFDVPFQNLLIYRIPATTTAATYRSVRQIAGRGTGGAFVEDIQPSWRP
jgi:dipeptidyl aminopeptidase/acylaminoacyl peptidase